MWNLEKWGYEEFGEYKNMKNMKTALARVTRITLDPNSTYHPDDHITNSLSNGVVGANRSIRGIRVGWVRWLIGLC